MRELTSTDARHGVLGGGVLACGGGGWKHHGELMGTLATQLNKPILASVDELDADAWVATVTAIGAPAAANWEIRPVDYVHALQALMERCEHPIQAVMTGQNGYSTTHNGWIQSSVLGVKVLDAAGDIRAHPTGKLGSLGLTTRPGYVSTQVVCGGNRELHGHFCSVMTGSVTTCDDVLRDISVRTGGFIAAARNPVELSWVKETAALGAISRALKLGATMEEQAAASTDPGAATVAAVCAELGGTVIAEGPLKQAVATETRGGWDHGTFEIGGAQVAYLNEYMTVELDGQRVATYPDTITVIRTDRGEGLAVRDAVDGIPCSVITIKALNLPTSASAFDPVAVGECEQLMGTDFLRYLPERSR